MGKKNERHSEGRGRSRKRWGRLADKEDELDEEPAEKLNRYPPYDPWEDAEGFGSYKGTDA